MDAKKRKALEKAGWTVGTVEEFLDLTAEDVAYIEIRLHLARRIREARLEKHWNQTQLASICHTTQAHISKMERGIDVSIDRMIQTLLAMGDDREALGQVIGAPAIA